VDVLDGNFYNKEGMVSEYHAYKTKWVLFMVDLNSVPAVSRISLAGNCVIGLNLYITDDIMHVN